MSTTQQLGADRCMMEEPRKRFGTFVRGSVNIRAKLALGWTILPSERNHLMSDYGMTFSEYVKANEEGIYAVCLEAVVNMKGDERYFQMPVMDNAGRIGGVKWDREVGRIIEIIQPMTDAKKAAPVPVKNKGGRPRKNP